MRQVEWDRNMEFDSEHCSGLMVSGGLEVMDKIYEFQAVNS